MKQLLSALAFLAVTLTATAQLPKPCEGSIVRIDKFKSDNVDARTIDIWLPEGYSTSKKYAVLYMHDGQMLYDSTVTWNKQEWMADEVAAKLVKQGKIKDIIIVGIWNNGEFRHSEYFPQKSADYFSEAAKNELLPLLKRGLMADSYLKFIVNELKPYIDSSYSTLKDQSNTFIAGSSMGGLISMYAICEYPNVFGGAACLSTHWIGKFNDDNNPIPPAIIKYMEEHLPSPLNHKIYFDHGDKTLDQYYKPWQQKVDQVMKAKGYTSKSWITLEFKGEDHSERAWQRRLHIPFEFIMAK
jgi:predicted alpha/beta superfamily hydrolase